MDVAIVYSRALAGIESPLVTVEVHLSRGLPGLSIVGMPETAVKESKERVRSAILNVQLEYPLRRITINLAPADLPKDSGRFDLAIAVGILAASGQVDRQSLPEYEMIGELALTGRLRPVRGVLSIACATTGTGRALILPAEDAAEAALVDSLALFPAGSLADVFTHLNGQHCITAYTAAPVDGAVHQPAYPDLADVRGQPAARRAVEVAAAGAHNLLMVGPPGSGKTMLAERLPGILPPMTERQALQSAAVHSVSRQGFSPGSWRQRPYRAPHHTASAIALVGGGSQPRPGEISLAHNGVLFLDELPEFSRRVLEVLREPMESGRIVISRAAFQARFPAEFQLVAAMNPCPCGAFGEDGDRCRCSADMVRRYLARISGPLLDRFDMHIDVPAIPAAELQSPAGGDRESSYTVRERVTRAYQRQVCRSGKPNSRLLPAEVEKFCALDRELTGMLIHAAGKLCLSARAVHRVLKVTLTIADLDGADSINAAHLAEALGFRRLERTEKILSVN